MILSGVIMNTSDKEKNANYITFLLFIHTKIGPGVKVNHLLSTVVGNIDMVPTAARVLRLKPSPWWRGTVMTDAFEDGVLN